MGAPSQGPQDPGAAIHTLLLLCFWCCCCYCCCCCCYCCCCCCCCCCRMGVGISLWFLRSAAKKETGASPCRRFALLLSRVASGTRGAPPLPPQRDSSWGPLQTVAYTPRGPFYAVICCCLWSLPLPGLSPSGAPKAPLAAAGGAPTIMPRGLTRLTNLRGEVGPKQQQQQQLQQQQQQEQQQQQTGGHCSQARRKNLCPGQQQQDEGGPPA